VSEQSAGWAVGAAVVVRTLGRKQGVIEEADARGRYRVRVEGITTWCREEDLAAAEVPKKPKRRARRDMAQGTAAQGERGGQAGYRARLDLHGLRVDEALERVDEEINRALLRGADAIEIVHGRGTGRIRAALHRHLGSMSVVAAFRLDPRNPGVTWVHF
jgi:DNA mismatch repair protein MutS2